MNVLVVPTAAERNEFNRKASKLRLAQLKNTTLSAPKVGISTADKLKFLRQSYQIAQARSEDIINASENSVLRGHEQSIVKVYGALSTLLFASICGSSSTIEELESFIRRSVSQIPTAEFDFYGEWQLVMNTAKECRQQGPSTNGILPLYQRKMKLFQYTATNSVKLMKNELILLKNDVLLSLANMNEEMFELFSNIKGFTPQKMKQLAPPVVVEVKKVEVIKPVIITTNKASQTDVPVTPKASPVKIPPPAVVVPTTPTAVTPSSSSFTTSNKEQIALDLVAACNDRLAHAMNLINGTIAMDESEERQQILNRIEELRTRLSTVDKLISELDSTNQELKTEVQLQHETMTKVSIVPEVQPAPVTIVRQKSFDTTQVKQSLHAMITSYEQRYQANWKNIEKSLQSTDKRITKLSGLCKQVSYDKIASSVKPIVVVSTINNTPLSPKVVKPVLVRDPSRGLLVPKNVVKVQSIIRGFLGRVRVKKIHTIIAASEQGVLVAFKGTKQGETGWYIAQDQLFYFVCHNGEFILLCGPISKDIYDIAREELNASPRFAINETRDKLPINLEIDRHGLHSTRIQIETLIDDLKTRDALIEQLYEDIAYLQDVANNSQNIKMTHQSENVLLRRQIMDYQGMVDVLNKEKHRLQMKDSIDQFHQKLQVLNNNSSNNNNDIDALRVNFIKLSCVVRGYLSRQRVRKIRLFRQAHETGVLVAMKNTVQGESGWYVGPNGTIFYFVLKNGEWIHTAGPITEKDFQFMRLTTKMRVPVVSGEVLSRCAFRLAESHDELFEQGDLFVSNHDDKLYLALSIDTLMPSIQEPMELSVSAVSSISKPDDIVDNLDNGSLADSLTSNNP